MSDELKPIRCYVSLAGNNKIADWYNDLTAQGRSDADEFIKNMRKTRDWKMPNYRPRLKGYRGIGELRWTSEKKSIGLSVIFRATHSTPSWAVRTKVLFMILRTPWTKPTNERLRSRTERQ